MLLANRPIMALGVAKLVSTIGSWILATGLFITEKQFN